MKHTINTETTYNWNVDCPSTINLVKFPILPPGYKFILGEHSVKAFIQ